MNTITKFWNQSNGKAFLSCGLLISMFSTAGYAQLTFDNGGTNTVDSDTNLAIGIFNGSGSFPDVTTVDFTAGDATGRARYQPTGEFTTLIAFENSVANISGGSLRDDVISEDQSTINQSGGTINGDIWVLRDSTFNITGGSIAGDALSFDDAILNINGGTVGNDVLANMNSVVNIDGAAVEDDVEAGGNSTVNIFSGSFAEDIEAFGRASVFIHGGSFDGAGRFDSGFSAGGNSLITIFGSDFKIDGISVPFGDLTSSTSGSNLMGTLASGDTFNVPFDISRNGVISLTAVPEPSTYAAIAGALGFLYVFNRRKRRAVS
ncbi:PEP-CTERM sorting domain-containing protein [Puniceicoccaceae bacterium K14]|nr:PEP-CTERM sorting domain-containing protein [Puniceicoccaceae bacterium K14]